jgi:hypothetical protein
MIWLLEICINGAEEGMATNAEILEQGPDLLVLTAPAMIDLY